MLKGVPMKPMELSHSDPQGVSSGSPMEGPLGSTGGTGNPGAGHLGDEPQSRRSDGLISVA